MSAAWHHLRTGELSAARRWNAHLQPWPELPAPQREREQRMEARLLLAEGQAAEALELLRQIAAAAQPGAGDRTLLQTSVLVALAHAALRRPEEARQALYEALAPAHSEGYTRLFLDEGGGLAGLLHGLLPGIREKHLGDYARQILRAFAAERHAGVMASAGLIDPLSPQEARVLHLLSLGRSNPGIASELVVSVNTVKAHLKNIYRKLGVSSRLEAVAAARARETR
jgi:LuxR family maltose regulon positive regulatory protein